MTTLESEREDDLHEELRRRLHVIAERWDVPPPTPRLDLVADRSQPRRDRWRWPSLGVVPVAGVLVVVALVVAGSLARLATAPKGGEDVADELEAVRLDAADLLAEVPEDFPPGDGSDPTNVTWADRTGGGVVVLPTWADWSDAEQARSRWGFSLDDVDQFLTMEAAPVGDGAEPSSAPPSHFDILVGASIEDWDPESSDGAGEELVLVDSDQDGADVSPTPDEAGDGVVFAATKGDQLALSSEASTVQDWSQGPNTTSSAQAPLGVAVGILAGNRPPAPNSGRLVGDTVTSGLAAEGGFGHMTGDGSNLRQAQLLPAPFTAAGVGVGRTSQGEPQLTLVWVHDSGSDAAANTEAIGYRIEEMVTSTGVAIGELVRVESMEHNGSVVVVRMRPQDGQGAAFIDLLRHRDVPFLFDATGTDTASEPGDRPTAGDLNGAPAGPAPTTGDAEALVRSYLELVLQLPTDSADVAIDHILAGADTVTVAGGSARTLLDRTVADLRAAGEDPAVVLRGTPSVHILDGPEVSEVGTWDVLACVGAIADTTDLATGEPADFELESMDSPSLLLPVSEYTEVDIEVVHDANGEWLLRGYRLPVDFDDHTGCMPDDVETAVRQASAALEQRTTEWEAAGRPRQELDDLASMATGPYLESLGELAGQPADEAGRHTRIAGEIMFASPSQVHIESCVVFDLRDPTTAPTSWDETTDLQVSTDVWVFRDGQWKLATQWPSDGTGDLDRGHPCLDL